MTGPETPYVPFEGMTLADTFQLHEQNNDMLENLQPDNSGCQTRQNELDIRVIMGNPPYSIGQKNQNDNARNIEYPNLDQGIRNTYAATSTANLKKSLYDSYIRAFRWASDRIGDAGIIAFVSGSAWIERGFADGMRKCLIEEFSDLYIFHLRGDIRKNMLSGGVSGEGQNVFGPGSMTGISIAVLVKNPAAPKRGKLHFYDIGPDRTTEEKLDMIKSLGSIKSITDDNDWKIISPDKNNDWLDQVDPDFDRFPVIGAKRNTEDGLFDNYSLEW